MPDFEQVCRRLSSDSALWGKMLFGGILMAVPVLNFFAFGYLGRVVEGTMRGGEPVLPEWSDGAALFVEGLVCFVLFLGFGGGLFAGAYLLSLPFRGWLGPLAFVPFIPALFLGPPVVAAGWYRYYRTGRIGEAFYPPEIFRLLRGSGYRSVLPTLAFLGFVAGAFPLFPLAFFVGGIVVCFYYSLIFREVDLPEPRRAHQPFSVL